MPHSYKLTLKKEKKNKRDTLSPTTRKHKYTFQISDNHKKRLQFVAKVEAIGAGSMGFAFGSNKQGLNEKGLLFTTLTDSFTCNPEADGENYG